MYFPLVSILIPNYNKAPYLKETLDSILNQTYTNWECVIVDDYSTDDSWQILREFVSKDSRFRIFNRPIERLAGGNASRNFAFEMSSGDYVNWLDSDDVLDKDNIYLKVLELESDPNLDFVFSDIREFTTVIGDSKKMEKINFEQEGIDYSFHYLKGDYWIQTGLPLFRKDYLKKQNKLFDERITKGLGQESEFFVRLLLANPNKKICQTSILYYRRFHDSFMTNFYNQPYSKKYLITYLPYKLHFLDFYKKNKLNQEIRDFFKNVFNDMLLFLPVFSKEFWDLFFFGARYDLFKGRFQGLKILFIRVLKNFKLI